jgi:hypothetical protein
MYVIRPTDEIIPKGIPELAPEYQSIHTIYINTFLNNIPVSVLM